MAVALQHVMQQSQSTSARKRTELLQQRTFAFAKRVLDLCPRQFSDAPSRVIWSQLIRSAPAASGNLDEADEATSTADFIYKMKLVLRETKESRRWLKFIAACNLQHHQKLADLQDESRQLASIFATIIVNTARRVANERATAQRRL